MTKDEQIKELERQLAIGIDAIDKLNARCKMSDNRGDQAEARVVELEAENIKLRGGKG